MAEQHADPVTRPGLRIVTGSITAPAGSGEHPVAAGAVVPMQASERAGNAVRRGAGTAARIAGRLWLNPGRVGHALWNGKPETMAEHFAHVKSRAWVPPEMTGKPATFIALAGIAYHLLIGCPVKAVARTVDAAAERPLRLLMLAAFVSVFVLILLNP